MTCKQGKGNGSGGTRILLATLVVSSAVLTTVAVIWLPELAFVFAAGSLALALAQPNAPRRRGREPRA